MENGEKNTSLDVYQGVVFAMAKEMGCACYSLDPKKSDYGYEPVQVLDDLGQLLFGLRNINLFDKNNFTEAQGKLIKETAVKQSNFIEGNNKTDADMFGVQPMLEVWQKYRNLTAKEAETMALNFCNYQNNNSCSLTDSMKQNPISTALIAGAIAAIASSGTIFLYEKLEKRRKNEELERKLKRNRNGTHRTNKI